MTPHTLDPGLEEVLLDLQDEGVSSHFDMRGLV